MGGICLDEITNNFLIYPLKVVENEIHYSYATKGNNPKYLPKLPHSVGSQTYIINLPNGLTIYELQFLSSYGTRGIVGGPHRIFSEIHKHLKRTHLGMSAYLTDVVNTYRNVLKLSLDIPLLGGKEFEPPFDHLNNGNENSELDVFFSNRPLKSLKLFEKVESAGTEISYRYARCRGCSDCKISERIENISIQEEIEQSIIDKSVTVDLEKGLTSAKLPFLSDPTQKLTPNEHIA